VETEEGRRHSHNRTDFDRLGPVTRSEDEVTMDGVEVLHRPLLEGTVSDIPR